MELTEKLNYDWTIYDHDYEKVIQDIKLKSGFIHHNMYPNADLWNEVDKPLPRTIPDDQVEFVRLAHDHYTREGKLKW